MILQGKTPRSLSRSGLVFMLLTGFVLLPLVPTLAQSDQPEWRQDGFERNSADQPEWRQDGFKRNSADKRIIDEMKSCQTCHQAPHSGANKKIEVDKAHDEIVRLMGQVTARRNQLREAEEALKDALRRFEAQQAPRQPAQPTMKAKTPGKATDSRLEDVEKKLERLLKEVENLRKELRPAKSGSSSNRSSDDIFYSGTRKFSIPLRWNRATPLREALLFVTTDGGKIYRLAAKHYLSSDDENKSIEFLAAHDGMFGFFLATVDLDGNMTPAKLDGRKPTMTVVVDTVKPNITLKSEPSPANDSVKLSWEVADANLDPSTMRLQYRSDDTHEWRELVRPQAAQGSCVLKQTLNSWEVRMSATDKAGNVGGATLKRPSRN